MDVLYKFNLILLIFNIIIIFCSVDGTDVKDDTGSCYKRVSDSLEGRERAARYCKAHVIKGDSGDQGRPGYPGSPGKKGKRGIVGVPGNKGSNAECKCEDDDILSEGVSNVYTSCKSLLASAGDGYYDISAALRKRTKMHCKNSVTCFKSNTRITVHLKEQNKSFWLSEKDINIIYDVPEYEIAALQSLSSNVRQTITFSCKNLHVFYDKKDNSNAIEFWTWNDLHIQLFSTATMPVNYNMEILEDHCQDSEGELKTSTIELKSSVPSRLPVRDIYIKDVRAGDQELEIIIGDLCFS